MKTAMKTHPHPQMTSEMTKSLEDSTTKFCIICGSAPAFEEGVCRWEGCEKFAEADGVANYALGVVEEAHEVAAKASETYDVARRALVEAQRVLAECNRRREAVRAEFNVSADAKAVQS